MRSIAPAHQPGPAAHTAAQERIVHAAIDLFAEHGVGGTSLQMIADAVGVTKAAVYHEFRTKDEIILAAADAGHATSWSPASSTSRSNAAAWRARSSATRSSSGSTLATSRSAR